MPSLYYLNRMEKIKDFHGLRLSNNDLLSMVFTMRATSLNPQSNQWSDGIWHYDPSIMIH